MAQTVEQPLDPRNMVTGDCGATAGSPDAHEVTIDRAPQPDLLAGVHSLSVSSRQRLTLAKDAPYTVLARDGQGIIAAQKQHGKGRVVLVANRFGATNAGLAQADNALFLVSIARGAVGRTGHTVRFDEYHHGIGFAQKTAMGGGLWAAVPLPWRLALMHLGAAGLLLLYNGNRRFRIAWTAVPTTTRASTDYVNSMARLYRRSGAADIALEIIYLRFVRDLRRAVDAPNVTGVAQLASLSQQKYGPVTAGLQEVMARCEGVVAGERVSENDMLNLARKIEQYRRACQLVGV